MPHKVLEEIAVLRSELETQLKNNASYTQLCETSQKLDVLIVKYHKMQMMHNENSNCASRDN